jgi:hypothetical protein
VKPFTVWLRFAGDLALFLRSKSADGVIERRLKEKTSIKDVIESCGIPHPKVDVVAISGRSVGLDHTVSYDSEVEVFPVRTSYTLDTCKHIQHINIE